MRNRDERQPYRWVPGLGPDAEALQRLRAVAPMPRQPMGEAWFLAPERYLYRGLMVDDPHAWSWKECKSAITELTSGPVSFGHADEWREWFDFLLPRVQQRGELDGYNVYDTLISAVFVHCPDPALPGRPPGFRRDLLDTLGRHLMSARFWADGRLVPHWPFETLGDYAGGWQLNAHGPLSAACCLVLRYLEPELLGDWLESVFAIDDPTWRGALVVWLAGAVPLLLEQMPPNDLKSGFPADIGWSEHWLFKQGVPAVDPETEPAVFPFFSEAQAAAFVDALPTRLDLDRLVQWHDALSALGTPERDLASALYQYESAVLIVAERYGLD